jgi:hypothetical protein
MKPGGGGLCIIMELGINEGGLEWGDLESGGDVKGEEELLNFPKWGIGYPIVGEGERGLWKLCIEGGVKGGGCEGGGDPSFEE